MLRGMTTRFCYLKTILEFMQSEALFYSHSQIKHTLNTFDKIIVPSL